MPFAERRRFLGLSAPGWAVAIIVLGGIAWLVYGLIGLASAKIEGLAAPRGMTVAYGRIAREIDTIEQAYRAAGDSASVEMERRLVHAIQLQEQLFKAGAEARSVHAFRLERLLEARDTLRARRQWDRVTELEDRLAGEAAEVARVPWREELLVLRREINRSRAAARYKDLVRETQLTREDEANRAAPLRARADAAYRRAQEATAAEKWVEALAYFAQARAQMEELNQNFGRTQFADIAWRERLQAEEASLQGAATAAEIEMLLKGASEAARDRPEQAVAYYQRAAGLQVQLNQRWPQSRFFSTSLLRSIQEKQRMVQVAGVMARLRAVDAEVTQALAARQVLLARAHGAAALVLLESSEVTSSSEQASDLARLIRKHRLLAALGGTVREIQDEVFAQGVPLPGRTGVLLLRGEVAQEFYVKLMRFNPSHDPDAGRPVDAVTWWEAMEFCERLGWILGRDVHLPTAEDCEEATRWAEDYEALHGGVSEWLYDATDGNDAPVWPASGTDAVGRRARDMRAADVGFRVVIEPASTD